MNFLSVCSGIEAASCALEPLGFFPIGFSEIDKAASKLLTKRFPNVPNFGDFTKIPIETLPVVDVLIGGTPCQAFSVAGKRLSLEDARGNLTLTYAVLAHELVRSHGLRNALWENVPGCLSTADNAFGCFLGAIVGADDAVLPCERPYKGKSNVGWTWKPERNEPILDDDGNETEEFVKRPAEHVTKWPGAGMVSGPRARAAWRVLDAQYFGLAQRRQRVFVVVDFGDGADPAEVLFEPKSMHGNNPPSRETREGVAGTLSARTKGGGGLGTDFEIDGGLTIARRVTARDGASQDYETTTMIAERIGIDGQNVAQCAEDFGTLGTVDPVFHSCGFGVAEAVAFIGGYNGGIGEISNCSPTLQASGGEDERGVRNPLIAFTSKDYGGDASSSVAPTLRSMGHDASHANGGGQIAIAFDLRGREGGAQFEGPHDTANIRAASGGSSRSYLLHSEYTLRYKGIRQNGDENGRASEADTVEILRAMRAEIGEEAFTEWGLGISDSFQSSEILRSEVHGGSVRREAGEGRSELDDGASSRAQTGPERALREMRSAGRERRSPFGWEPSEQRSEQFAAALSQLSQQGASPERFMLDLWKAAEGLWILRQALSAVQDAWQPFGGEGQSTQPRWAVRRLTPREAERLQGFPDDWTQLGDTADGPRYKQLGNSMAVPVIAWIGRRLLAAMGDR